MNELVQAGTEQDLTCTGFACDVPVSTYYAWFEQYPAEAQQEIQSIHVHPGDDMIVSAAYDNQFLPTRDYFLVEDRTANMAIYMSQPSAGPTASNVEWIGERTEVNNELPPLANFGQFHLYNGTFRVYSDSNTYYPISASYPDYFYMEDNCQPSDLLAYPGSLDPDGKGFVDYWNNAGGFGC
jgi:hypothetical protein